MSKNTSLIKGNFSFARLVSDIRGLPQTVKALALVSAFMNITSVVITVLTPLLVVSVFGGDTRTMGMIEGVVVATFHVTKIFSGIISDFFRKRKILIVLGYGASALCMPIFALAPSVGWVFVGRFIERLSNGFRDAPRDALIGDVSTKSQTGICYGFRQALASLGSLIGPILVTLFMALSHHNYQIVFWWAAIPATIAVLICIFWVQDPVVPKEVKKRHNPLNFTDLKSFKLGYWKLVGVSAFFMMARYSEGFLVLRAESIGLSLHFVPLVLVMMNLTYFMTSIPIGSFADKIDRRVFLAIGFVALIVADVILASSTVLWQLIIGVMIWGVHMGMTQGVLVAMVANTAPPHLRGTAFGFFHLINGAGQFLGNSVAGYLWHYFGMKYALLTSAAIVVLPLFGLFALENSQRDKEGIIPAKAT